MAKTINTVHLQAGRLVVKDSAGSIPVAGLSDVTISHDAEDKPLPDENQMSVTMVRVSQKVSIKAKVQRVLSPRLRAAMFGGSVASNANQVVEGETHTAGATVAATNTTTFVEDLGVKDATGNWMTSVASAPNVGEYVAGAAGAGSYTFNAAETGTLSFSYIKSTTSGEVVTVDNQLQAASPTMAGRFWSTAAQPDGTTSHKLYKFYALVPSKLTQAQKRGDFTDSDIELEAVANSAGKFFEEHSS